MNTYYVRVSQEHIVNAVRKDSHHCMLADAIHTQIPWAKYVMVDLQSIRFSDTGSGQRYIYLTPPAAQKAILQFDAGKKTRAFTFPLTRGYTRSMRVRDPGYVPTPRAKGKKKSPSKRVMPKQVREFGLRQLVLQG